jgi:periplasmic divalent cation tolerance protein
MTGHVVALTTAPPDRAEAIADDLLRHRLVACVNLLGPVASRFHWQGRIDRATETLLVLKTRADLLPELEARLRAIHPYEVPELIAVPVAAGLDAYLRWITASCKEPDP